MRMPSFKNSITLTSVLYLGLTLASSSDHLVKHLPHIILAAILTGTLLLITSHDSSLSENNKPHYSLRLRAFSLLLIAAFLLGHTTPIHMMSAHETSSLASTDHPCCMPAMIIGNAKLAQPIPYIKPIRLAVHELPLQSEKPIIFTNKPPPTA